MERQRLTFPRRLRVTRRPEFTRAYDGRQRRTFGPLLVYMAPNGLPHPRLGMSVSRRVGIAVRRHRIKRLLREAFRLEQHRLPAGIDLVIVVRPHEPMPLERYRESLLAAGAWAARRCGS